MKGLCRGYLTSVLEVAELLRYLGEENNHVSGGVWLQRLIAVDHERSDSGSK
jgi:hypothetical protein